MSKIVWDALAERTYETGVDHGVLYVADSTTGVYGEGVAWNGLVNVNETPSGAEPNPQYADNIKYLNLVSAEELAVTIEAFTYPDEFEECDGSAQPVPGVSIGQQPRSSFGMVYRTKIGNAINADLGYKLHLLYGGLAAPAERAYNTVNDSPEATTLSWEISTTPVAVEGMKPTALVTLSSTKFTAAKMQALEDLLFGTQALAAKLPLPDEVITLMESV